MFGFQIDKRMLYIVIGGLLLFSVARMGTDGLLGLLLTLPGVLIAITFHEFAHAYSAYKLGDDTPVHQGRLNLNPFSHVDPIGFAMLIIAHFGWGRPVQIDPRNFNGKYSLSASEAIVAVAGPIMNFIVAIVLAIISVLVYKLAPITFTLTTTGIIVTQVLGYAIMVNIGLGVFNLIPLPPLDGSKVLNHFLPYNAQVWMANNEWTFSIVLIILAVSGIAGDIISPITQAMYSGIATLMNLFI